MMYDEHDRVMVRNFIVATVFAGWTALLWKSVGSSPSTHVHHAAAGNPGLGRAALDWLLMLVAMMPPVLVEPIRFVRGSSLSRRRWRSTLLFVVGYVAVWMAFAPVMWSIADAVRLSIVWVVATFMFALVWQCTPAKQACLNYCHRMPGLIPFGWAADFDALRVGLTHGIWCAGSCWAWMLLPLLLSSGHLAAMAVAAVVIVCERLDNPAPPSWAFHGITRAGRVLAKSLALRTREHSAA